MLPELQHNFLYTWVRQRNLAKEIFSQKNYKPRKNMKKPSYFSARIKKTRTSNALWLYY